MRVIHTICTLSPNSGGPARSVPGLCSGLMDCGVETTLCVGDDEKNPLVPENIKPYIKFSDNCDFAGLLKNEISNFSPEVIHDHAIWSMKNHMVCKTACHNDIPLIVSPRGMLEPWSLNTKKWKKKLAMLLYQRRDLMCASALHATAESEAGQFRKLGFKQPIIVSPNGVTFPTDMPGRMKRDDGKKVLLFVSRIHPKKGLLELIEAWAALKKDDASSRALSEWHVEFAGPDYDDHLDAVNNKIKLYGLGKDFTYIGILDDESKWKAYRRADLFVLPTFSENFGIVVAEALAAGVPVITTKGTPWSDLNSSSDRSQCGWWIDVGVEPLKQTLKEAMDLPEADRLEMGDVGRGLVKTKYAWPAVALGMRAAYDWLLNISPSPPSCVVVD